MLFRSQWRRAWMVALWLIICIALFTWKFTQYRQRKAFEVMGYCLSTAKGAAETLKFNMALILLPVCRNTITWLRRNLSLNSVIPFNDNLNFHKVNEASVSYIWGRITKRSLIWLFLYLYLVRVSLVCPQTTLMHMFFKPS